MDQLNPPSRATKSREIIVIQQLRGIAALLVVIHHSFGRVDWIYRPFSATPNFGTAGVDIFFVISGCVMYVAARHEKPAEFCFKRLLRIVPLYWLVTLVFVAMRFGHWGSPDLNTSTLIQSLLFIPHRVTTGEVWPVLVPGWSLNVELFFYLLFCIGLAFRCPAPIAGVLVMVCVGIGLFFSPMNAALALYTSPILLEFVIGLLLGNLFVTKRIPGVLWPALPLGALIITFSDLAAPNESIIRGIGGVLTMVGALALEAQGRVFRIPALNTLGNSSYALYLVHTPLLLIIWQAFKHVRVTGWPDFLLFFTVAVMGSIILALCVHYAIERPLLRFVRHRWRTSTSAQTEPVAIDAALGQPPPSR